MNRSARRPGSVPSSCALRQAVQSSSGHEGLALISTAVFRAANSIPTNVPIHGHNFDLGNQGEAIRFENVRFAYQTDTVLDDVTIELELRADAAIIFFAEPTVADEAEEGAGFEDDRPGRGGPASAAPAPRPGAPPAAAPGRPPSLAGSPASNSSSRS